VIYAGYLTTINNFFPFVNILHALWVESIRAELFVCEEVPETVEVRILLRVAHLVWLEQKSFVRLWHNHINRGREIDWRALNFTLCVVWKVLGDCAILSLIHLFYAPVKFFNKARVRSNLSSKVVQHVIIDCILGALVVKIDLFVALQSTIMIFQHYLGCAYFIYDWLCVIVIV